MLDKYNLTLEQNLFLANKLLVQSIYNSAKLEGLNVTFPEVQTILDGVNIPTVDLKAIECIINLRSAWKFSLKNISAPLDLDFICKVNDNISRNNSVTWGVLRTDSINIGGKNYNIKAPQYDTVTHDIKKILAEGTATEKALNYFLYGVRNQPFWIGNKSTSFICANKKLISNGAGILALTENELIQFTVQLKNYYNTNNPEPLKKFLYHNCIVGIEELPLKKGSENL